MEYAVEQDLLDRWGEEELLQVADRTNSGVIDSAFVARALGDAQAEVDGYLEVVYSMPLQTVPTILTKFTCDLAMHNMSTDQGTMTDEKENRRKHAVKTLRDIAQNKFDIGVPSNQTGTRGAVTVSGPPRTFSRESLRNT